MANVTITPKSNDVYIIKPKNNETQYYLKDDAYGAAADVLGDSNDTASDNTVFGAKAYADGAASTAAAGVVGASGDASTANTVYGAKAYADSKITALGSSTITNGVLELAL